jgi:hypothetical protein
LPRWFRPEALERIRWHKERGDTVVVVSASLRPYLEDLCRGLELELVCTELEARGGVLTGRYLGGDCTGPEKARRVRAAHDLARYSTIHAYGDTREDADLLELATRRYYRWRAAGGGQRAAPTAGQTPHALTAEARRGSRRLDRAYPTNFGAAAPLPRRCNSYAVVRAVTYHGGRTLGYMRRVWTGQWHVKAVAR